MLRYDERLGECLGDDFANVFPDEMPQRADAPELLGGVESMPGAGDRKHYDLDDFVTYRKTRSSHSCGLARLLHDQPWARMLLRIHVSEQPK
ncbi:hypothetical protein GHK53_29720 [Sinorhizobium meliloti]|uniref:Uncharacterized protein n=1 Tax=Rhizobium meliloti TaxID=382 RepID=A0AAW9TWP3_RHIML|nr:hypothetical protein [Sinorhizobium meliloti]